MKKPAQVKSQAIPTQVPDPWDHWWRRSPIFMFDRAYGWVARPGAEFWYENFWKPRALSAWMYELVRRWHKLTQRYSGLAARYKDAIPNAKGARFWPPYVQLNGTQKSALAFVVASQFGKASEVIGDPRDSWRKEGRFSRLGDWRQIEALDGDKPIARREASSLARYICRYWPVLDYAWRYMEEKNEVELSKSYDKPFDEETFRKAFRAFGAGETVPEREFNVLWRDVSSLKRERRPRHELSGCTLTAEQLRQVIERVNLTA